MNEKIIKDYYEKNPEGVPSIKEIPEIYEMHNILKFYVKKILPEKLLDAGCGKGFTGESISMFTKNYYGFDISSSAIKIASKKIPNGNFKEGTIRELPYSDEFFDCVICSEVLEHVIDYKQAIKELARVTQKNRSILITTPNKLNPDMIWRTFIKGKYTKQVFDRPIHYKELIKEFKKNNLEIKEFFSFFYLPIFGESLPKIIKNPLMKLQKLISKISKKPLGLYLFFELKKK